MRLLLISNSGTPFLEHCQGLIADFLGQTRTLGYITAARIDDAEPRFQKAREALSRIGITAEHIEADDRIVDRLHAASGVFVGGGNTYALLSRLRSSRALKVLRRRVRDGMPYIGTSAGSNVAGPTSSRRTIGTWSGQGNSMPSGPSHGTSTRITWRAIRKWPPAAKRATSASASSSSSTAIPSSQ